MANAQGYGRAVAPAGSDTTASHNPMYQTTEHERQIFDHLIKPDDMYDEHGVYFHDLPLMKKIKFVLGQDAKEAARELGSIWAMTKKDPLAPVSYYFRNMVLPGAGLGLEG